jgi:DNA (cytosine-5)-methyltransferase 1
MPTFGSLFAGIGGIDLGLERAGWTGRWQVEWDDYCQRVLAKHWPDIPRYGDITTVDWNGVERVDLIAGGFPCQPFSVAGRRKGLDDDRWLWPEFARAVGALRPSFVLVENVPGLLAGGGMGSILGGLADLGYDAEWDSIPAAAVGAPHLRYRVWIVAYRAELGRVVANADIWRSFDALRAGRDAARDGGANVVADANRAGSQGRAVQPERPDQRSIGPGGLADAECSGRGWRTPDAGRQSERRTAAGGTGAASRWSDYWLTEPDVGRVAHGVPARVDRLRALGNAVVPQVVEVIGRQLLASIERVA